MRIAIFAAAAALALGGAAFAQDTAGSEPAIISLNGVRVAAADTEAVAEFYKDAFGMVEVQRIPVGPMPEIMLNWGGSVAAAQANTGGDIVIYPRESDDVEDPVAHVVLDVSAIETVVADVAAHGGTTLQGPFEFGDTGIFIAIVADPAGNQIELIQGANTPVEPPQ